MAERYTLVSHGTVLGHTGAAFPAEGLPVGASLWHLITSRGFEAVEPDMKDVYFSVMTGHHRRQASASQATVAS